MDQHGDTLFSIFDCRFAIGQQTVDVNRQSQIANRKFFLSLCLCVAMSALAVRASSDAAVIGSPTFPIRNEIDKYVLRRLQQEKVEPSGLCTDEEFVRRVYLDVCGVVPPLDEAKAFLADHSPDKRARLIDRLLASERYADHWSALWGDLLREHSNSKRKEGTERGSYRDWIRDALSHNMPYDQFARELINATGSAEENGAVNFYLRDEMNRVETANTTADVFMGTRMACAQCHDHPFDKWTQQDFHSLMAFYGRTVVVPDPVATLLKVEKMPLLTPKERLVLDPYFKEAHEKLEKEKDLAEKNKQADGGAAMGMNMEAAAGAVGMLMKGREFIKGIEKDLPPASAKKIKGLLVAGAVRQVAERPNGEYHMPAEGDGQNKKRPNGGDVVAPVFPWDSKLKATGSGSRREKLAAFITGNHQFAAVHVNRLWAHLFGRGFVEPADDFREKNPPSNPELLASLTDELIHSKFDTQHVLRLILNSSTYQRSSTPNATNRDDSGLFSHQCVRRMTAEQMFNSILVATGHTEGVDKSVTLEKDTLTGAKVKGGKQNQRKAEPVTWAEDLPTPARTGSFMNVFNQPPREQTVVKRDDAGSITQALEMLNGDNLNNAIKSSPKAQELAEAKSSAREIISELYMAVLTRQPTPQEISALERKMMQFTSARDPIDDLYWALLNSREFTFVK